VAATAVLMAAVETHPQQYCHEDIEGRLGDLLWMASLAARRAKPGFSRIAFEVILHLEGTRRQHVAQVGSALVEQDGRDRIPKRVRK
jgi:hypothetical protein